MIVESAHTAMTRVLGGRLGEALLDLHRDQGVRVLTSAAVSAFRGHRHVEEVVLADGARIQLVGHLLGDEEVLTRGSVEEHTFTLLFFRGAQLAGAFSLNRPRDFLALRPAISREVHLRRELLADPAADLQQLFKQYEPARASA